MIKFLFVISIDTDRKNGVTLKNMRKWLTKSGYVNKVDYRHCGTKRRHVVDIETLSGPAYHQVYHQAPGNIISSYDQQFNRFRFYKEEDAIAFKLAWG